MCSRSLQKVLAERRKSAVKYKILMFLHIGVVPSRCPGGGLTAVRSRLGSDSHSGCHSPPRRRFATPPEGCINSGSSKYALACFGVLELVYAKSERGADCAKMQNLHRRSTCKVAVSFGTFLVRQEKYRKTFIQQKQQKKKSKLYTLHKITLLRQKILDKAPMLAYNG